MRVGLRACAGEMLTLVDRHITDSQSWPLVLPGFPLLAEKGAYSVAQTYNASEIADIASFAAQNGVSVFLEVDVRVSNKE